MSKADLAEKKEKAPLAKTKHTGNPLLDSAINKLNKQFSKNLITMGPTIKQVPVVSTTSLALDVALGVGGFGQGRIIEIMGPNASGKTSLGLAICREMQKLYADDYCLVADMEYTQTGKQWEDFGLDPNRTLLAQADTANEIFQIVMDMVKTGTIRYLLFDSIDACQTESMLNKDVGANDVGGISKIASRFFREYSKEAVKNNCTSVFINQIKMNPGMMFGDPRTTPGGTALGFYASHRLEASTIKPSKTMSNAFTAQYKIKKNKLAPAPTEPVSFDFIYNWGPDPISDTLNAAKDLGILAFSGPTLKLNIPGKESKALTTGGAEGWARLVKEDPEVLEEVRAACFATLGTVITEAIADEPLPNEVMLALAGQLPDEQPTT